MANIVKDIHYVETSVSASVLSISVKRIYDHLKNIKYKDGLCGNCGLSYVIRDTTVFFSNSDGKLKLDINFTRKYNRLVKDRMDNLLPNILKRSIHSLRVFKICDRLDCGFSSKVGGLEGDSGVSFVLELDCPLALRLSQENYNNLSDSENLTVSEKVRMNKFNKLVYGL